METYEFIEHIKKKYPFQSSVLGEENDEAIYDFGMDAERRYLPYNEQKYLKDVSPIKDDIEREKEIGDNFMYNLGSYGFDLTDWPDMFKDAYNNSIIGMYEGATTGETPYQLSRVRNPQTGQMEEAPLTIIEKGASFVMSMFMPADIATFFGGGTAFKYLAQAGKGVIGRGLKKHVTNTLYKGHFATGVGEANAKKLALRDARKYMMQPNKFLTRQPIMHKFIDDKSGETVFRQIFNGKTTAAAWKLQANALGGSLATHRGASEAVQIMYNKGQRDEKTGEWVPGELEGSDWGKILPPMMRSYATGLVLGGIKALSGGDTVTGWAHDSVFKNRLVKVGDFGAESLAFASVDPFLTGRAPTMEELKHSGFNLLSIRAAHSAGNRVTSWVLGRNTDKKSHFENLEKEIKSFEEVVKRIEDPILRKKMESELNKKTEEVEEILRYPATTMKWEHFETVNKKIKEGLKEIEKEYEAEGKPMPEDKATKKFLIGGNHTITPKEAEMARAQLEFVKEDMKNYMVELEKAQQGGAPKGEKWGMTKEMKEREQDIVFLETVLDHLSNKGLNQNISIEPRDISKDISIIKEGKKKADWTNEIIFEEGYVEQVKNNQGKPLYHTIDGTKQVIKTNKDADKKNPVLKFKGDDNASKNQFIQDVNYAYNKKLESKGIKHPEMLIDNMQVTVNEYRNRVGKKESSTFQFIFKDDGGRLWGDGSIAARNKDLVASVIAKNYNYFLNARGKEKGSNVKKIRAIAKWSRFLKDKYETDLTGTMGNSLSPTDLGRIFKNEYNITESPQYRNSIKSDVRSLYADTQSRLRLSEYMPGKEIPIDIPHDPRGKLTLSEVGFGSRRKAHDSIQKGLLDLEQDRYSGDLSAKWGITNEEASMIHLISYLTHARPKDVALNFNRGNIRKTKDSYMLDWIQEKDAKYRNPDMKKESLKDGRTAEWYDEAHERITNWLNKIGETAETPLFPNLRRYLTNDYKGSGALNNYKPLWLEHFSHGGDRGQPYVIFRNDVGKPGGYFVKAGDPLRVGQAGTDKADISNIWRKEIAQIWEGRIGELQKTVGHDRVGTTEGYLLREGFTESIEQAQQLEKFAKKKNKTTIKESRFIDNQLTDKTNILQPESFQEIKKDFLRRNPGAKIIEEKLPKKTQASTEFTLTNDLVRVELGKTTLTDLFHENMERLLHHTLESGDAKLLQLFNKGIKSATKEAKAEWNRYKQRGEKPPYKTFEEFRKEWFVNEAGKYAAGKYVDRGIAQKVSRWMKETWMEFRRYWLGLESDKFDVYDLAMLVGKRGFKGVDTLRDIEYRNAAGGIVYSNFETNKPTKIIHSAKRAISNKLEERARKTGIPTKQLFTELRWKEKFFIKSFAEVKDKETAALLLSDMEANYGFNKITNDYYKEATIGFNRRFHDANFGTKGGLLNFIKSGEFQQFFLEPGVMIEKFGGEAGTKLVRGHIYPFRLAYERYVGSVTELKDFLETHPDLKATSKDLESIAVYDPKVLKTGLTPYQEQFRNNWLKNPKGREAKIINAVKSYYHKVWTKWIPEAIDRAAEKGVYTKRQVEFIKKKLKSKHAENYLTHSLNPKLKKYLLETKEGNDVVMNLAKKKLRSQALDDNVGDKQYKTLQGKINSVNKKIRDAKTVKLPDKEISSLREELDILRDKREARFEELFLKEGTARDKEGIAIDEAYREAMQQLEYNPDYIFSPNVDLGRYEFNEFYNIENPALHKKYGKKPLRTWDTSFDGTVIAYGKRMATFMSAIEHMPEKVKFATKGKEGYKLKPMQGLINEMKFNVKGGGKEAKAFKKYIDDTIELQLGMKTTSPSSSLGKTFMQMSRYSAAMGLSSPFSGVKNLILGQSAIFTMFGPRAAKEAWKLSLDPEIENLALLVGAKEVGQRALSEVGVLSIGGEKVSIGGKQISPTEIIAKLGGMAPTEWSNRKRAVAASVFYASDGFKSIRGGKTHWYKGFDRATFLDRMKNQFHMTDKELAVGIKYGINSKNIPENHINYSQIKDIQRNIQLKSAQFGHQITQGATGITNLPLWFNRSAVGKWSTVFHRIAFNMTTNYKRNVIDPLVKFNNPMPLLRYSGAHLLGGYALWQLSDFFLGHGNPHEAFDSEEDYQVSLATLKEYGYRAEFGSAFSILLNPYSTFAQDGRILDDLGIVNLRNLEALFGNTLAFLNGKKWAGQAAEDMVKSTLVAYNHAQRAWYKQSSPYLTNHKKVRKSIATFERDLNIDNSGFQSTAFGGGLTEKSPWYRKLRHAFMLGEAGGSNGYVNAYWGAHDFLVQYFENEHPNMSRESYNKKARESLHRSISSYKPVTFSTTDEFGQDYYSRYMSKLTPEFKYLVRKLDGEFKKKDKQFWLNVNLANRNGRYTKY